MAGQLELKLLPRITESSHFPGQISPAVFTSTQTEMDKLTIISGCLFLAADIFAIASVANPDWINTGESAGKSFNENNTPHRVCLHKHTEYSLTP